MEIVITKSGALAINPRTIVSFNEGDVFTTGDKGFNEGNLKRLIELGFAETGELTPEVDTVEESLISGDLVVDDYAFESFETKEELEVYARDVYGFELDKRKSLKKMAAQLKEIIEKDLGND